jgi:hypothetical protein
LRFEALDHPDLLAGDPALSIRMRSTRRANGDRVRQRHRHVARRGDR